jgi:DNA-binding CsgD family transcriptional regulator
MPYDAVDTTGRCCTVDPTVLLTGKSHREAADYEQRRLISQGLSNAEIADALTLSVRTIEGHIYRACARVGTATRTELAQLVTQFAPGTGAS